MKIYTITFVATAENDAEIESSVATHAVEHALLEAGLTPTIGQTVRDEASEENMPFIYSASLGQSIPVRVLLELWEAQGSQTGKQPGE